MPRYYVNIHAQSNGDHEVHKEGCSYMPSSENRINLGDFSNCHSAVRKAEDLFPTADGCYWCSPECHKS